jgi:hypothetical protein
VEEQRYSYNTSRGLRGRLKKKNIHREECTQVLQKLEQKLLSYKLVDDLIGPQKPGDVIGGAQQCADISGLLGTATWPG